MTLVAATSGTYAHKVQSWRFGTCVSSRVWPLHAGGDPRETMGDRVQRLAGRGAEYEVAVGQYHHTVARRCCY